MKTRLATLGIWCALTAAGWADGGAILQRSTVNGLDVTIFAAPSPLRAGPVDFSVLVQKAGGTDPILDAEVTMAWSAAPDAFPAWMPPCCSMEKSDKMTALRGHSKNRMLYSAMVPVRSAGPSKLLVRIDWNDTTSSVPVQLIAAPPRPPALAYWPWLAFPPVMILGFALNQRLKNRR